MPAERGTPSAAWPERLAAPHRAFLTGALEALRGEPRLLAVAAGGSFISGEMDTAQKIERGEQLETLDALAALRRMVLGPLSLAAVGAQPQGVRRVERLRPDLSQAFAACVSDGDPKRSLAALRAAVELYAALRSAAPPAEPRAEAERAARAHLAAAVPPPSAW